MIYVAIDGTEALTTGIMIRNELTHTPDTCSFRLDAPDSVPEAGQEVVCRLDTMIGEKLFAGTIVSIQQSTLAPSEVPASRLFSYAIECQDYSRLLNQRLVIETYVSKN